MSLFDKTIVCDSPVTADYLRQILEKRKLDRNMSVEERFDRILNKLYESVMYTTDSDVYSYSISSAEIGIKEIFTQRFLNDLNTYYMDHHNMDDICEWVSHNKELSPQLRQFRDFLKNRGFGLYFHTDIYFKTKPELLSTTKLFEIHWGNESI